MPCFRSGLLLCLSLFLFACIPPCVASEEPTVVVASLQYPPYIGRGGVEENRAWAVVKAAFAQRGYHARKVIVPWARALQLAENGEVDAIFMINKTPEREKWGVFSDIVGEERQVIWLQKQRDFAVAQLTDLKRKRVGVLRNSFQQTYLTNHGIFSVGVKDVLEGLHMLHHGRIDAYLAEQASSLYLSRDLPPDLPDGIEPLLPPVYTEPYYLSASRKVAGHEKIIQEFNAGLAALKASDEFERMMMYLRLSE